MFLSETRPASGLITDLYQLTMAAGYWRQGMAQRRAVFHLYFRRAPFGGTFAVACGLEPALNLLAAWRFTVDDLGYLAAQTGNDGKPLFQREFLQALGELRFTCDVDALPEGTPVFPQQPMLRVEGPLWQAQMVETALLSLINFQTLIATKASRICRAAAGDPVLEFGLRRAHGLDGGHSASRAAYVGGCVATSNVWAGRRYGIPVGGTHAHSWVQSFPSEVDAFRAYAEVMPNNCTLLVDTYKTERGIDRAVEGLKELQIDGHRPVGLRLDSGDLAALSRLARSRLDAAGLNEVRVVASNDLDEHRIRDLKAEGAAVDVWGVGTRLITGHGQGALGGVYKLAAMEDASGVLQDRVKISEDPVKSSLPGIQQIRRLQQEGEPVADLLYSTDRPLPASPKAFDRQGRSFALSGGEGVDLLQPILRRGEPVGELPSLADVRRHAADAVATLPESVTRLEDPESYPVGIESGLYERWQVAKERRG